MESVKSYATGYVNPKTTSLFFDKLVLFDDNVEIDRKYRPIFETIRRQEAPLESDDILNMIEVPEEGTVHTNINQIFFNFDTLELYANYRKQFASGLVPVFDFFIPTATVGTSVISVVMESIPKIVEESLSWDQILEIRKDKRSIDKLRRFRQWIYALEGKKKEQITLSLEIALDDYKYALKKHGILTATGAITTFLSAGSSIVTALAGSQIELLLAGLVATGGAVAFATKQTINLMDQKRAPIAFIYDVVGNIR